MVTAATSQQAQSEAYIATMALFLMHEEKSLQRLPLVWKDLWHEKADVRKAEADEVDKAEIRNFREIIRRRKEQEDEEGVLMTGAFRHRGTGEANGSHDKVGKDKVTNNSLTSDYIKQLWREKTRTNSYQMMLVSSLIPFTTLALIYE